MATPNELFAKAEEAEQEWGPQPGDKDYGHSCGDIPARLSLRRRLSVPPVAEEQGGLLRAAAI